MIIPIATYRVQFRNSMTFARAAELAPYFAALGVSHIYGSPIFQAKPDSTHGYDVTDARVIDVKLGGEKGFAEMIDAFRSAGLGFIADFVPNHMSASPQNPFWRDVLEWGQASEYAQFFDIDWSAPKLLVPMLATGYGRTLEQREFKLSFDASDGGITFVYGTLKLPLTPPSYAQILVRAGGDDFAEWSRRFAVATPDTAPEAKAELASAARSSTFQTAIEQAISAHVRDIAAMHDLHEAQCWRLTHWRAARETLTYRRFFEIADLVGLKVENPRVFEELHVKLGELLADGRIDGLRIDHVDGLADPKAYLERLQKVYGRDPLYLLVEKILAAGENLPVDWPVAGTTGYEFIAALVGLLVDPHGETAMTRAYDRFVGEKIDYRTLVLDTKRRILTRNLAGELDRLKDMAGALAARHLSTRDFGTDTLRRAIIEFVSALPVYRTYIDISGAGDKDKAILGSALETAKATREIEDEDAIDFIGHVLTLDFEAPDDQAAAVEFTTRLQQTSGPVMAKAVEDTTFYRYNRLIALNEVGGGPDRFGASANEFHAEMARRLVRTPAALSATSTHDTKRGEDARARLYVLSEMPDAWRKAVNRWSGLTAANRSDCSGRAAPEPDVEWMFYQALLGAWPTALRLDDDAGLTHLSGRMIEFMLKAVREAKVHTSWTGQNEEYENAVRVFTAAALDPARSRAFLEGFVSVCEPIFVTGALNSLAQTAIKLTAPGVPDIYQGSELWDLSLVDPDNRRSVDFGAREAALRTVSTTPVKDLVSGWRGGAIKMRLIQAGLRLRSIARAVFERGDYLPLMAEGKMADHALGFARVADGDAVIVVAPRHSLEIMRDQTDPLVPHRRWHDTKFQLPQELSNRRFYDAVTSEIAQGGALALRQVLRHFPVGILSTQAVS